MPEPDQSPPPLQGCAVCGRPLDYIHTKDGRQGYAHATAFVAEHYAGVEPDHPAIPADFDQIVVNANCDFCFVEVGQQCFTVPCEPFVFPHPLDPQFVGGMSALWLACPACAELISRRRWSQLVKRSIEQHNRRAPINTAAGKAARKVTLEALYERVQVHQVGPVRPSTPEDFSLDYQQKPPEEQ